MAETAVETQMRLNMEMEVVEAEAGVGVSTEVEEISETEPVNQASSSPVCGYDIHTNAIAEATEENVEAEGKIVETVVRIEDAKTRPESTGFKPIGDEAPQVLHVPKADPTGLLLGYINSNLENLVGPINTLELLHKINAMYREACLTNTYSLRSLCKDLKHHFKCSEDSQHHFQDLGLGHATRFDVAISRAAAALSGSVVDNDSSSVIVDKPQTNQMIKFLTMEDQIRGCSIVFEPGSFTELPDFKEAFEQKRGDGEVVGYVADTDVFQTYGFEISSKMMHVCKSCKKLSKGLPFRCCEACSEQNRWKKFLIHNMVLKCVA